MEGGVEQQQARYTATLLESPFGGYLERFRITRSDVLPNLLTYLEDCFTFLEEILRLRLKEKKGLKFWLCASTTFHKSSDISETTPSYFPNIPQKLLHDSDIAPSIRLSFSLILGLVDQFEEKGSSWVLSSVDSLDLYVGVYEPMRASSYIPLPMYITRKRAVVNPKNYDQKCFLWAVLAALYPVTSPHPERVSHYEAHVGDLVTSSITFPTEIDQIGKFCSDNQVSINVYAYDEHIYPIRLSKQQTGRHVNLLYYHGHYCWIKSFDRLMGDQNKHKSRGYYCETCLFPFYSEERLNLHRPDCGAEYLSCVEMPRSDDNILRFVNHHRILRKPTVVYADFEALLEKLDDDDDPLNDQVSYTHKYQKHVPCSTGLIVCRSCCGNPTFGGLFIETCDNPAARFLRKLVEIAEKNVVSNSVPLAMTPLDDVLFLTAVDCVLCGDVLEDDRVRDHCHVCGGYRAALHSACNQSLRLDRDITVVLHNLRRYDSHIIMREMGNACEAEDLELKVIAKAMEDYTTFYVQPRNNGRQSWRIRFIDSVQFLSASLDNLVQALPNDRFVCMKQFFSDTELQLLTRKGVFPYDYLDDIDKLKETSPITKEMFYNKLTESDISVDDYEHYLKVWKEMGVHSFQDYLELYLKTDVLLLADVFEAFRKFSIEKYGLDPCHYSTLPGLAWDACLKMTKIELELLTDPDMYAFMEKGIRGGMACISKRFSKAGASADGRQPFIMYFDGK